MTLPGHSSASNEHYSPSRIVEAARLTLGSIDLDPASCPFANRLVCADRIFTKETDGFVRPWSGLVFLNPPGGRRGGRGYGTKAWWFKLAAEFRAERVTSAIFVGFTLAILQTTQVDTPAGLALPLDFPMCFPSRRVAYDLDVEGERTASKAPPHASVIVCVSSTLSTRVRFASAFRGIGRVVVPMLAGAA